MKAQLDSDGRASRRFEQMIAANKASIPGNNELDAVAVWVGVAAGQGRR